ncbi:Response regulator of the LytR/AlgR family, partial [human gut metagenome]
YLYAGTGGIRLAQSMKHYAPFCQIIFLSSYLSYATEVYETEHIYFILKSQLHQRIGPALHQALTALGRSFCADHGAERWQHARDRAAGCTVSGA